MNRKKEFNLKKLISAILIDIIFALIGTIIIGYFLGFTGFVVVGWSSEPDIPIYSFVVEYKNTSLQDLKVGDYITWSRNGGYVTHQIIAINKDGFYNKGDVINAVIEGTEVSITLDFENENSNYNIITKARDNKIDGTLDYINYKDNFRGKVTLVMPTLGRILYFIRQNTSQVVVAVGILICFYFIFKVEPLFSRLY